MPAAKSTNKPSIQAVPTLQRLGARINQKISTNNMKSGRTKRAACDQGKSKLMKANSTEK
jgi:hypothetical protein